MKKGWLIAGLLTLVIVGVAAGGTLSYGRDDTLPDHFIVGGLEVGGESAELALRHVRTRIAELESTVVSVEVQKPNILSVAAAINPPPLTLKQLGMKIEADEALKAIEQYGDYSWWERAKQRYQGKTVASYGMNVTWDNQVFMQAAGDAWGDLVKEQPVNAARTINDQDLVVYTEEKLGRHVDLAAMFAQVKKGQPVSLSTARNKRLVIELPVIETSPEVTIASLKKEGLNRKIMEFTTSFTTSGEGRSHNVTVAALALNDTLLMPDEVFDYGKIVAKAEEEYGYKEAPVIVKGKLTPGVGGGICQVSSTLYNAVLLTGLDIVERRNHSLVVSYLPKGLDATFASGYVNFKFRNTTGKQLLIRTVVKDKTVTVKLFGTMPDNISYQTETGLVKEILPKITYVANDKLALGKQETLQKGESGYVVESYLVKLVDGEPAERKKLSKDTYRTQDTLIAVNPGDPRLAAEPGAEGGSSGGSGTEGGTPAPSRDEGPVEPV